jgi:uncharacterized protein YjbI with pentapeptide repeats
MLISSDKKPPAPGCRTPPAPTTPSLHLIEGDPMTRRSGLSSSIGCFLRSALGLAAISGLTASPDLFAQAAGQNINMVSGTKWPGGDPFLQRQNEPSLAVSSRNSLHLLAGANDYRTVDLPTEPGSIPGTLSGDAWLGVFKSYDGGLSWQSTLLPGYPQDKSAGSAGLTSPLKAYSAAADPTVRAAASGLFYYSGIAFNRGTNIGAIFVSRHFDLNNKENGDATDPSQGKDAIVYVDTKIVDTGTSGQFLDKPWIAVDQPRGATTCSIPVGGGVTVPAGNVYMVWSRFTGSTSTKIMFSRSTDCGKTWSNPTKLSESNSINQGTNLAVDPNNGNVFACWRRFATSSAPDAILCARSTDAGNTFPSKYTSTVATLGTGAAPFLWAFDQGSSGAQFRTNALPTMAVSFDTATGKSLVHVAWAARPSASGDSRIYVSSSPDGLVWSAPVAADTLGISDDFGNTLTRGHQFMPQLTFSQGRLMLLYYDQRLDHTLGLAYPTAGFPDANGRFYLFKRDKKGELLTSEALVYTPTISDASLVSRRHTIDLRVASKKPADAAFTATTVSEYKYGLRVNAAGDFVDETGHAVGSRTNPPPLAQLQTNVPNLPLFAQGTVPFVGDYIDIAGPAFVPGGLYGWTANTAPSSAPVFYATWTDNRDVVPPADGDWTHYTPVGIGGPSVLDPTQQKPACASGQGGMRNQNVYVSRITDGLLVGSLQNVKPLSPTQKRAFVVTMQNLTGQDRAFRMTLSTPNGASASFLPDSARTTMDVTIGAHLGAARPVFATAPTPAATIVVNVAEITSSPAPLLGSVILNPEGSAAQLVQPDGAPPLTNGEIYTPSFATINISNTNPFINISNANENINISNATTGAINISNPDPAIINISNSTTSNINISNTSPSNINISNINISNTDPAVINISNTDPTINISNSTTANINISNINISNINISNINISNTPVTDATYQVTNSGNTSHSYRVALYGSNPNAVPLQLITTKTYGTPTAAGCALVQQSQNVRYADVSAPLVASTLSDATNPAIADSDLRNSTLSLAPGESAFVTLRGNVDKAGMEALVRQLTPVVTAHGANPTGGNPFAMLLFIQTGSASFPAAVVGVPFTYTFQSAGGSGAVTWTVSGGTLPAGLTLGSSGLLSGTPTAAGSFPFTVTATDGSTPQQSATQDLVLVVGARKTTASPLVVSPSPAVVGQAVSVTMTVTDSQGAGTVSTPVGTVTVSGGTGITGGSCDLPTSATGPSNSCTATIFATAVSSPQSAGYTLTATYGGSSTSQPVSANGHLDVNPRATSTAVVLSPAVVTLGQAAIATVTVTDVDPNGVKSSPAGTVTVSSPGDTFSPSPACTLAAGTGASSSCSVTLTANAPNGPHSVSATYSGSAVHAASASAGAPLAVKGNTTTAITSIAPSPYVQGTPTTVSVTVSPVSPATGAPTGTVTISGGASGGCTLTLVSGAGSCSWTPLAGGSVTLTATYGGDTLFNGSATTSSPLTVLVTFGFTGFGSPLTTAGTLSNPSYSGVQNLGSATPIKFQLTDGAGVNMTDLAAVTSITAVGNPACSGAPTGASILLYMPTVGATGGSTFRSSSTGYVFNWDTSVVVSNGPGCYTLVLQLNDASAPRATTIRLQ